MKFWKHIKLEVYRQFFNNKNGNNDHFGGHQCMPYNMAAHNGCVLSTFFCNTKDATIGVRAR